MDNSSIGGATVIDGAGSAPQSVDNTADLVRFDPEMIADRASFVDPHRYPEGIDTMIVNGVVVIDRREHTGTPPDSLLRRCGAIVA